MKRRNNTYLLEDDDKHVYQIRPTGQKRVNALHEGGHHGAGHERDTTDEGLYDTQLGKHTLMVGMEERMKEG